MSITAQLTRTLGLAVFTASLFACSGGDVRSETVTAATLSSVRNDVTSSSLDGGDKTAFERFVDAHSTTPNAFEGKTVNEIITMQRAYEHGQQLAANEREEENEHRIMLARLIRANVLNATEDDAITLHLALANLSGKTVTRVEMGLFAMHGSTRIGMCELALDRRIEPHLQADVTTTVRYSQFGEDATPMMHARGTAKTFRVEIKEIKYADGSDAGYDD